MVFQKLFDLFEGAKIQNHFHGFVFFIHDETFFYLEHGCFPRRTVLLRTGSWVLVGQARLPGRTAPVLRIRVPSAISF
jgi:hypothetical protein